MRQNRSLMLKFTGTYLIAVTLVILAVMPIYFQALKIVKDNIKNEYTDRLESGISRLESEMLLTQLIASNITTEPDFLKLKEIGNSYPVSDLLLLNKSRKFLSGMAASLEISSELMIIFSQNQFVITPHRVYQDGADLLKNNLKMQQQDFLSLKEYLFGDIYYQDFVSMGYVDSLDQGRFPGIGFLLSLPIQTESKSYAAMMTVINGEKLLESCDVNDILLHGGGFSLYDHTGGLLYQEGAETAHTRLTKENLPWGNHPRMTILKGSSSVYGLTMYLGIPERYYTDLFQSVNQTLLLYLVLAGVVGILLALFFAYRQSIPINRILSVIGENKLNRKAYHNEYDYIHHAIENINRENVKMQDDNQSLVDELYRKNVDRLLLLGVKNCDQQVLQPLTQGLPPHFRIFLFRLKSKEDRAMVQEKLTFFLQEEGHPLYLLHRMPEWDLVLLTENMTDISIWLNQVILGMQQCAQEKVLAVAGSEVDSLTEIQQAFRECRELMRYMDYQQVLVAEDFGMLKKSYAIDFKETQRLSELLLSGDYHFSTQILLKDWYELSISPGFDNQIEQLFYYHKGILTGVANKVEYNLPVPEYNSSLELVSLALALTDYVRSLSTFICERKKNYAQKSINEIFVYMDQHYCDPNFYMIELCTAFKMSDKTMGKIIKEATGKNFSEYLEQLRLNHATGLLTQTELPVSEIAGKVGFHSQNTFYKMFKRAYGVSPTTYRNSQKKEC